MNTVPYTEQIIEQHGTGTKFIIRTFTDSVEEELVWHRDHESRLVHVLEGRGWKLQLDDKLPQELNIGQNYHIPKMGYHRLIKGNEKLVVRIQIT
tara:strand:+ start:29 stop:313 length:285 start_codon:yes stop_codon:yes gene_type:complete